MARPPKGKPLTFRPLRLDDDVWAECQRLGKEHGTINEGLRTALFGWAVGGRIVRSHEEEDTTVVDEYRIDEVSITSRPNTRSEPPPTTETK